MSDIEFNGHYLINNNDVSLDAVNLYISYALDRSSKDSNINFTLANYLFGYVKLIENSDPDKYKKRCYGIGFDSRSEFLFSNGSFAKKCHYFWS